MNNYNRKQNTHSFSRRIKILLTLLFISCSFYGSFFFIESNEVFGCTKGHYPCFDSVTFKSTMCWRCCNDKPSVRPCSCTCNTCSPPACPSGTSTANTGDICFHSTDRTNCGFTCNRAGCGTASNCFSVYRSCWYLENKLAPGAPAGIRVKIGDISCILGNDIRIPYPNFNSGDGFLAYGAQNNRLTDIIRGTVPLLQYRYRLPELSLASTWLGTSIRYAPPLDVTECDIYTIYAGARSINRCEGWTNGSEISRSFEVNYIPRVVKIEPIDNPNDGVSGHLDRSGSSSGFDCEVDNPKRFTVVFKDDDGCGDLWDEFEADTNICGGVKESSLLLQAIDQVSNNSTRPFSGPVSPVPGSVRCEGTLIIADFELEFEGDQNYDLHIQAKANDIVGDTSDWQTGLPWSYDGQRPELDLESNIVVGVNKLNVQWGATDDILSLSGVRGLRISSRLTEGNILKGSSNYSPIIYDGVEYDLYGSLGEWVTVWNPSILSGVESKLRPEVSGEHLVNIGINQDGYLDFRFETVDRACNYATTPEDDHRVILGSPWIATRGGLVHSGGDIKIAVKQSLYDNILVDYPDKEERTSLSSELLTVGGNEVFGFGFKDYVYDLLNYDKRLTYPWYDILLKRASYRDPSGILWSQASTPDLDVCANSQHIYFVDGDLAVDPEEYEILGKDGLTGCIFIVRGNVTVGDGEYKSAGVDPTSLAYRPGYDIVRGYFISDGYIDIPFSDGEADKEIRDGLKIVGGLFSTGNFPTHSSIRLSRSLQLRDNLQFPTLIISHDSRYLDLGRKVLGDTFGGGYVRDIGLKE